MALTLTQDEVMIVDTAKGLIGRAAPVSALRKLRDEQVPLRWDKALHLELAGNGLVAPNVGEADGGLGLGVAVAGLIIEQAGHTLAAAPLLSAAIAAQLIAGAAGDDQRADWLARLVSGELVVAAALDEASRHDPTTLATRASADGRLAGRKTAVIDGVMADLYLVSALDAEGAVALYAVEPGAPGLTVTALDTVDSRNCAQLTFAGTPAKRLDGGPAAAAIASARDVGRALLAAELLGLADEAFDRTVGYLKERVQFGRAIGTYQALQHRAARLYARLDLARGVVLKALRSIDEGDAEASHLASLAKAVMTRLARDVLVEAVQMHGGIGVTDEFDIGLFLKRVRVAGELLGDDHFHTERLLEEKWNL